MDSAKNKVKKTPIKLPKIGVDFFVKPDGNIHPIYPAAARAYGKPPKRVKKEFNYYTKTILRTMRNYEYALHAKAQFESKFVYMLTLTFPLVYENDVRHEIAMKWIERLRKKFPSGGMWNCEVHELGPSVGLFHFHIKIVTNWNWRRLCNWKTKQSLKLGLMKNSIHLSKNFNYQANQTNHADVPYMYKVGQKNFKMPAKLWGEWKIDAHGAVLSWDDLNDVGVNLVEIEGQDFSHYQADDIREAAYLIQVEKGVSNISESFED